VTAPTLTPTLTPQFTDHYRGGSGTPLVALHGFTDTWRSWDLVIPQLERWHDVFAPTLKGHTGGPRMDGEIDDDVLADDIERRMDEAGIDKAHFVGNSLGAFVSLQLASRGRAESVVAFAPAGGHEPGDPRFDEMIAYFHQVLDLADVAAPNAEAIMATPEGRRLATQDIATNYEHIPAELLVHQLTGIAACTSARPLLEYAKTAAWKLDAERIDCPVRIVWGTADRILNCETASRRHRKELPNAEWVEMDGIGHCPQLDVPAEAVRQILSSTAVR
jgi:pimeloyl-ACP methyl ester carboxylesterase